MKLFAFEHTGGIVTGHRVVVAPNLETAHELLIENLKNERIFSPSIDKVTEIDLMTPRAYTLFDGTY